MGCLPRLAHQTLADHRGAGIPACGLFPRAATQPIQNPCEPFRPSDVYMLRHLNMPKTDSLQGSLDLLVLKILSRRPRLHGYAIMTAIQAMSGEVLRAEEGSLYPALHRMEEAGWIRAEWVTNEGGRRARVYQLTAAGRKQLGAEESRWLAVTAAVNRVLRTA
jgi:PadR family transcriptional regulator, regulatory protein PadR